VLVTDDQNELIEEFIDYVIAVFIVAVFGGITWAVYDAAEAHEPYEPRKLEVRESSGPRIPICDEPLWERVKNRCSDE